jgi:hypothetical protein
MIYTIDNPKLVKDIFDFKNQDTFTGVVKDDFNNIGYYLNGKLHREDGPAMQLSHGMKEWWLNDNHYGDDDDFTNESWIRFVKLELLK